MHACMRALCMCVLMHVCACLSVSMSLCVSGVFASDYNNTCKYYQQDWLWCILKLKHFCKQARCHDDVIIIFI